MSFSKNFNLTVTYYNSSDTSIENISTASSLPTNFSTDYPDSIKIDISGYKTGPALEFEAIIPLEDAPFTVDQNDLDLANILFDTSYNATNQSITFIYSNFLEKKVHNCFSLFI